MWKITKPWEVVAVVSIALLLAALVLPPLPKPKVRASRIQGVVNTIAKPFIVKWTPEFGPDGELDFSGFAEHETTAGL